MGEMIDSLLEYILVNYRWVFVIFFLLPLSLLFEVFSYGRNWIVFNLSTAPRQHGKKVREVQRQVRNFIFLDNLFYIPHENSGYDLEVPT